MTEDEVARLYTDYGYVLFRRCLAFLGDPVRAEDALQEVFVRALRGAASFRGEASPRTWLCRIADHLCLDLLRSERRNPIRLNGGLEPEANGEDGGRRDASPAGPAGPASNDGEAALMVRQLMLALDPELRRLAVLHYMDELTQEELARELGLSRRTIGKRLETLRDRARALLAPERKS